jgi:hypothetical protein
MVDLDIGASFSHALTRPTTTSYDPHQPLKPRFPPRPTSTRFQSQNLIRQSSSLRPSTTPYPLLPNYSSKGLSVLARSSSGAKIFPEIFPSISLNAAQSSSSLGKSISQLYNRSSVLDMPKVADSPLSIPKIDRVAKSDISNRVSFSAGSPFKNCSSTILDW